MTALAAALVLPGMAAEAQKDTRPNLLFIITDDHAVQAMSTCKEDTLVHMPGFKRMADEGMVFDRAYCANSICGPSRACMMTGRHSHNNGFLFNYGGPAFNGDQPTYPKMLQAAGYQTGVIGKWHLVSQPVGFDSWQIFINQGEYINPNFLSEGPNKRTVCNREMGYATDVVTSKAISWMEARDKSKPFALIVGHKAPHRNWIAAPRHLEFIKKEVAKLTPPDTLHDDWSNRPEFLKDNTMNIVRDMSNWYDVHLLQDEMPFDVLKECINKHALRRMIADGKFEGQIPADFDIEKHQPKFAPRNNIGFDLEWIESGLKDVYHAFYSKRTKEFVEAFRAGKIKTMKDMTEQRWRWYMEDYLGSLYAASESVDALLKYLDSKGLSENTLVIYVGDQGFYLGEHGLYDKRWIFEQSMRMPLIMRWKGHITPGKRSQALVQNIDYAPTILEVTGTDTPENMRTFDGKSLVPLFKTGEQPEFEDRPLYYCFYEQPAEHNAPRHDGIRTKRYTFARIWTPTPEERKTGVRKFTNEWMLIDNEKDPKQMVNVAADPAYAQVFADLKAKYEEARKQYRVPADSPGVDGYPKVGTPSWGSNPEDRMPE